MDARKLRGALTGKLGGSEDVSGHHVFFYFEVDGKQYGGAKLSHSAKGQLDDFIVGSVARKLKLTRAELADVVACSRDRSFFEAAQRSRPRPS